MRFPDKPVSDKSDLTVYTVCTVFQEGMLIADQVLMRSTYVIVCLV